MTGAVYLLDKAAGITSRRAAAAVAKAFDFKKYGHCGTLDPDATGLLVVILGKATRLAPYISGSTKRYSFDIVFGISTDTLDMSGEILSEVNCASLTTSLIQEKLPQFTGLLQQQVPRFSAVRIGGKRGYKLAREGKDVEMPSREVTVTNWAIDLLQNNRISCEVTVSTGTYIRALARDIGESLGFPAVADNIRRTKVGNFLLSESAVESDNPEVLISMAEAMKEYPAVIVPDEYIQGLFHGNAFPASVEEIAIALNHNQELIAIGIGDGKVFQPKVVLADQEKKV